MATANDESTDTVDDVLSEELVALQAIYIKELSVDSDEENRPQSIAVILHPATGMDESKQYVCMTLCFTFPPNYPDAVPEIMVKNPRGLGEENLQSLIEDMLKKAEERKGGQMLYELIEMAKDCLTDGNLPHCECAICLDHFEEGDNFIKTDCYHYYHKACLAAFAASFMASSQEEVETEVLHIKNKKENVLRCPMCRVPVSCDLDDLLTETPSEEKEVAVQLSPELIRQQQERAALYDQQKAKGGIIDLEHEKNKYLVDENTVVPLFFSRTDGDSGVTSGEKPPEPNGQPREWEPPATSRKEERPYNNGEGGKPRTSQGTANQNYAGNRSRKSHKDDYADISQGYSDYEEDWDDGSHRGSSRGGRRTDHRSDRGRGSARKQRESQPTVDQTSRNNQSWKRDSDFANSGQDYSDFVPSGADSVRGGRNDRTRGRGANRNYRGHRQGGGGRDHNRTYHRDDREDLRDSRDGQNHRRDHRDSKHDTRDSTEHLRDREKNERRDRKNDLQESSGVREESDRDGGGADSFENSRDFGKDAKEKRPRDSDTRDGGSSRTDGWHDRTSPRDHRDQGLPRNERTRGGQYRENTRNRQGQNNASQGQRGDQHRPEDNRDRPRQNREREYRDTRPRGYHRQTGDRERDRNSPREPAHSEKMQGSTGSPRENEGYSKQQDYRNHRRDFPDDRYRNQRSDDSRQYSYQRRNENYHGSRRDDNHQVNDKDTHARRNQKHEGGSQQFGKTYDGENQRRYSANRQNSHEADDSETLQEDAEHGWNKRSDRYRGDRTFVRGQGKRGGRTQNRPPSTQSDTGNPSQTTTGRRKEGRKSLEEQLIELISPVEQGSKKTGQSAKDGTRSDVRCRTSNEDLESDVCKSHTNKPQPSRGQRFSKQEKEHGIGEQSEKHFQGLRDGESGHGQKPPSGVSCPRPPPGFAQQGKNELSQSADPPRPAPKVAPPPGFS